MHQQAASVGTTRRSSTQKPLVTLAGAPGQQRGRVDSLTGSTTAANHPNHASNAASSDASKSQSVLAFTSPPNAAAASASSISAQRGTPALVIKTGGTKGSHTAAASGAASPRTLAQTANAAATAAANNAASAAAQTKSPSTLPKINSLMRSAPPQQPLNNSATGTAAATAANAAAASALSQPYSPASPALPSHLPGGGSVRLHIRRPSEASSDTASQYDSATTEVQPAAGSSAAAAAAAAAGKKPVHIRHGSLQQSSQQQSPASINNAMNSSTTSSTGGGGTGVVSAASLAAAMAADDFATLDQAFTASPSVSHIFRIVRMCAATNSCDRMQNILETQIPLLIGCTCVRMLLVMKEGFAHPSARNGPWPMHSGITGYSRSKRSVVCVARPHTDSRYNRELDAMPPQDTNSSSASISAAAAADSKQQSNSSSSNNNSSDTCTALLCVPVEADTKMDLSAGKDIIAMIQCFKDNACAEPYVFSEKHICCVTRLTFLLGNMLRSYRSVDRVQNLYNASLQGHARSAALLQVAKKLASSTAIDEVVNIIVSQVPELLDCDRCSLFFVDRERQELIVTKGASKGRTKTLVSWIFGQSNAPELPFPKGQNEIRFSMHSGLAGHVASTCEFVNIDDAHTDKRFNSTMDKETGYRTRSLLCVPMCDAQGDCIGVVQAINKNPALVRFDAADETLLKTFSAQAALAVRTSQLFARTEKARQQSDALLEVTNALSSELKIDSLIKIICSKVQQLLLSERCTVFIVDAEKRELYTSASMSYGMGPSLPIDEKRDKLIYFPMDRGIAGAVATTGECVNIKDAYLDSRFNQAMDRETGYRTRSILCVPIRNHRNDIVGVLQVMNKCEAIFDHADEQLLLAFCAQAAVAIENSRLFQQTEKALNHALADQRNLKFMLSVTKNMFSDMHLTSMCDQLTMQVHHLLKADDCALYLCDADRKEFWTAKDGGSDAAAAAQLAQASANGGNNGNTSTSAITRHSYTVGIVGHVASTGVTVRISSEAHKHAQFTQLVDGRRGKTTHSLLCCPIVADLPDAQQRVVGVISVRDEKDRGGFEAEEERLLKVFCAQAAVAINNSSKFSSIMIQSELQQSDHSAADYLKGARGMNLASDSIDIFQFKMDDIILKGAIGTGSYGEVYRAQVNGQIVAVKKLHVRNLKAEQVDAFCKEAGLMCQLNHPNIVGFIGAVTEPSNLAIITQYCARGSLADLLVEDSVSMTFKLKLKFATDAARGMHYLHTSNPSILHRSVVVVCVLCRCCCCCLRAD